MCVSVTKEILELSIEKEALMFGEFTLSAGGVSNYYFDGRIITLDPQGANLVAQAFLPLLIDCGAEIIAGPTLGADPIVASVSAISYTEGTPISGLIVRKETKSHGGMRAIEGPIIHGTLSDRRIAVVDDTCSTGSSLFMAIDALEMAGSKIVKVLSILDRQMGGSREIIERGYDFQALLEADENGNIRPL